MVDFHMHTEYCGHAEGRVEEYIANARMKGLRMVAFTDHAPLWFLPSDYDHQELMKPLSNLDGYLDDVKMAQWWYDPFPIALGLELDYIPGCEDQMRMMLDAAQPDFVLGSIHYIDGKLLYDPRSFTGSSPLSVWDRYLELSAEAAETGLCDAIAHIDVLKGYLPMPTHALESFRRSVRRIVAAGVSIETNTSGLRQESKTLSPDKELLRICFEEGASLTVGSDAHKPGDAGEGIDEALSIIKGVGYESIAVYSKRKRTYLTII